MSDHGEDDLSVGSATSYTSGLRPEDVGWVKFGVDACRARHRLARYGDEWLACGCRVPCGRPGHKEAREQGNVVAPCIMKTVPGPKVSGLISTAHSEEDHERFVAESREGEAQALRVLAAQGRNVPTAGGVAPSPSNASAASGRRSVDSSTSQRSTRSSAGRTPRNEEVVVEDVPEDEEDADDEDDESEEEHEALAATPKATGRRGSSVQVEGRRNRAEGTLPSSTSLRGGGRRPSFGGNAQRVEEAVPKPAWQRAVEDLAQNNRREMNSVLDRINLVSTQQESVATALGRMQQTLTNMGRSSSSGSDRGPFYAVGRGREVGIYHTSEEAERQTTGFSGARMRRFDTREAAQAFINSVLNDPSYEDEGPGGRGGQDSSNPRNTQGTGNERDTGLGRGTRFPDSTDLDGSSTHRPGDGSRRATGGRKTLPPLVAYGLDTSEGKKVFGFDIEDATSLMDTFGPPGLSEDAANNIRNSMIDAVQLPGMSSTRSDDEQQMENVSAALTFLARSTATKEGAVQED